MKSSDLTGKTCLVTGATSGIGLEAAVTLARSGATTVVVARNTEKGEVALREIQARSGSDRVSLLCADFSSLQAIRRLATEFQANHSSLHILVNNAGACFWSREVTEDGFENHFGVNHLAPFLLTNLLLDVMRRSGPARIVNVASIAHKDGTMDFDNLQFEKGGFTTKKAYGRSKLANMLFTFELAKRLEGTGVTVNCVHPGVVSTGLWAFAPSLLRPLVFGFARLFFITAEEGARPLVYLASSPEVEGVTGRYFKQNNQPAPSTKESLDPAVMKRLWEVSSRLTGP